MSGEIRQATSSTFRVLVDGAPLPDDVSVLMSYAFVEDNLNLPDMVYLSFLDPGRVVLEKGGFEIAAKVEVSVQSETDASGERIFTGEITALETEFDAGRTRTIVRGFDRANRLYRGRRTRAFTDVAYSDVVKKVAREAGLELGRIETPSGRPVRHLAQANMTDAELLTALSGEVGFVLAVDDGKVNFHAPPVSTDAPSEGDLSADDPLQLTLGDNLLRFNATVTADSQVKEVSVRGWDVQHKRELVGTAPGTTVSATVGITPAELARAFGDHVFVATDVPYGEATQVEAAAKALADGIAGTHAVLEGVARGNPKLRAGKAVSLGVAGAPFEGKYTVTVSRHTFDNGEYVVHFSCTGRHERSLQSMTAASGGSSVSPAAVTSPVPGVVSAIVTNVKDPDGLCQVKVKIPRLDDQFESDWLRVVQPGAGKARGTVILPEVEDEVIVGFEHGDIRRGYVLGGVYNGKDLPDTSAHDGAVGSDGRVERRSFTSRKGHFTMISDKDGDEYVEISTKSGEYAVKLAKDTDGGAVLVTSKNIVKIAATGDITISGRGKISIEATGDLALKGQKITLEGQSAVEVKAAQVSVAGTAMLDLDGGTNASLHAALVKIN